MSDSVRPHRWQPTRHHHPWNSPGKNTGVGCHFLLQCMKVKSESEVAQLCPTLSDPMDYSLPGSSLHGIFQARVLEWGAIAFSHWNKWRASNTKSTQTAEMSPIWCALNDFTHSAKQRFSLYVNIFHLQMSIVRGRGVTSFLYSFFFIRLCIFVLKSKILFWLGNEL